MKTDTHHDVPRRGGRPSQEQATQIGDRILDAARDLFFTQGYGATSIEAIAGRAHISKRTFYARFKDKGAVFEAVVRRVIGHLRPSNVDGLFAGKNCAEILHRIAGIIIHASLMPEALAMHRLMLAEAARFPELALATSAEGSRQEAVTRITALLQAEVKAGRFKINNPEFAAEQFLQMVIALPQKRALGLGKPMTQPELDLWVKETVRLFLGGCRGDA